MRRTTSSVLGTLGLLLLVACSGSPGVSAVDSTSGDGDAGGAAPASGADAGAGASIGTSASAAEDATIQCSGNQGVAYAKYKTALFGNLHQHTSLSLDAFTFGTRATPADAYLFAKKQKAIQIASGSNAMPAGPTVQIDRPLDFLAVTDHSEWLGIDVGCNDPQSPMYPTQDCADVRSSRPLQETLDFAQIRKFYDGLCGTGSTTAAECVSQQRSAWQEEQKAAADAYEPCRFTSLVAYEWTSSINGDTNHRNVLFGSATVPTAPLDSVHYPARTDLWSGLDQQCSGACSAITAPHNSNLSGGLSLTLPATAAEATAMAKYQRLAEIYQHKGDSECFYSPTSPADPACAFEYVDPGASGDTPASYVRTALENGLSYAAENPAGPNPLALGILASTDDHNAAAGLVAEDAYVGHLGRLDDSAEKRLTDKKASQYGSGGLAVVWAEQNTRSSIYAALMRKETYGTSGPRILLRFFATSSPSPCTADFPQTIVDQGAVPMGGTFGSTLSAGGGPTFAVAAWPDAVAQPLANGTTGMAGLAKVQIIKAHGATTITEDPPVDLAIEPAGQCLTWRDPHFTPGEHAFYYVRVLQLPTWRWSHFDCQGSSAAGCQPGGGLDVTVQERAWSSPIWYAP